MQTNTEQLRKLGRPKSIVFSHEEVLKVGAMVQVLSYRETVRRLKADGWRVGKIKLCYDASGLKSDYCKNTFLHTMDQTRRVDHDIPYATEKDLTDPMAWFVDLKHFSTISIEQDKRHGRICKTNNGQIKGDIMSVRLNGSGMQYLFISYHSMGEKEQIDCIKRVLDITNKRPSVIIGDRAYKMLKSEGLGALAITGLWSASHSLCDKGFGKLAYLVYPKIKRMCATYGINLKDAKKEKWFTNVVDIYLFCANEWSKNCKLAYECYKYGTWERMYAKAEWQQIEEGWENKAEGIKAIPIPTV